MERDLLRGGRGVGADGARRGPAVLLLRRDLASARRRDTTGGRGRNRYRCTDDERLPRHGRAMIAAVGS
ncbi:hypothetical protein ACFV1C_27870 [Streptomyces sp. NPDC059605]|uniref:hypothetical protein n=1 Tax=unclassified Streptomyces TaxID=2593676 RepID=UPI0036C46ED9